MPRLTGVGRIGPHCKLDSWVSDARRLRFYGPATPPAVSPCFCIFCGCPHFAFDGAPTCPDCAAGDHCERGSASLAESALSVRGALVWGDWRLWTAPRCQRCEEPVRSPGALARLYSAALRPLTGHRTPADCVTAALGDPQLTIRVLRRLHLHAGIPGREGDLA